MKLFLLTKRYTVNITDCEDKFYVVAKSFSDIEKAYPKIDEIKIIDNSLKIIQ